MTGVLWTIWIATGGLLTYVYAGYPLLSGLLARIAARPHRRDAIEPSVSLIILAYNEERDIAAKLENSLALDYPSDKLEIVVASDGSEDRTDEIVRGFADRGVRLFRADEHPGKTGTTNRVVPGTQGEILVFSDATGVYGHDALRALVRNFADPEVGAVSGRVTYTYGGSASAEGFDAYQKLVVFARKADGEWGTETSTSGSITAIRRELFRPIPSQLDFDMANPLHVALAGRRTVYEPEATSGEEAREEAASEFGARVRMAVFAFSFLPYLLSHLRECQNRRYVFQMLSHKVLRWLSPFLLLGLLASSALLASQSTLAVCALTAQLLFYALAGAGYLMQGSRGLIARATGIPLFFVTINLAFLVGGMRWLRGERIGTWKPER